jgi:hypothetical protein
MEQYRLRVFENRLLREVLGPKRYGVTGEWRGLHKEEIYDLYSSINSIRVINGMGGACGTYRNRTAEYRILGET